MKSDIRREGARTQARLNAAETSADRRKVMQKMSFIVRASPLPQYCAPRIPAVEVSENTSMFCTNCTWVASETAAIAFCAIRPSITASAAATEASIRFCTAMGSISFHSRALNSLSANRPFI